MANSTYKNWKAVTEADFVSLFIKTWFAYISTLRVMFPEAYNRRGDKKFLNAFKDFYIRDGHRRFAPDEGLMGSIEKLYTEGRKVIMRQYPEYYLWDFYRINESFQYTFRDIPPNKNDCLVVGLKLLRNRGTAHNFSISGFIQFFGEYYKIKYDQHVDFELNISDLLKASTEYVKSNPQASEQNYLSWLLDSIGTNLMFAINDGFRKVSSAIEERYGKRLLVKANEINKRVITIVLQVFALNRKDETYKTIKEMQRARNSYEVIQQRPLNYFQYHTEIDWKPSRELTATEETWFKELDGTLKQNSIIWFLDFVYRLRNALFHEIIDPLDEEWQIIFKNAYLVLKEIVDLNIEVINATPAKAEKEPAAPL